MALDADLDRPALKVPFERLSQTFRKNQKLAAKTMTSVSEITATITPQLPKEEAIARLKDVKTALEDLRQAAEQSQEDEVQIIGCLQSRLDYLATLSTAASLPSENGRRTSERAVVSQRKRAAVERGVPAAPDALGAHWGVGGLRMQRAVGEWLLLEGLFDSWEALVREVGIDPTVADASVHRRTHQVSASLRACKVEEALAWCRDHGPRLRRLDSTLEFRVRKQQFLELVRAGMKQEALAHACEFLSSSMAKEKTAVQEAMGTLALNSAIPSAMTRREQFPSELAEYAHLFSLEAWEELARVFELEARRVYGLSQHSSLEVCLQAGLSAFKTPHCCPAPPPHPSATSSTATTSTATTTHGTQHCPQCPTCSEHGVRLARDLAFSHHTQTSLICRISGERMDENNRPLALPNGHVYSAAALTQMASENEGLVRCPVTGSMFSFHELREIFII